MSNLSCILFLLPYFHYFIGGFIVIPFIYYLLFKDDSCTDISPSNKSIWYEDSRAEFTHLEIVHIGIETIIMGHVQETCYLVKDDVRECELHNGEALEMVSEKRQILIIEDISIMEDIIIVEEVLVESFLFISSCEELNEMSTDVWGSREHNDFRIETRSKYLLNDAAQFTPLHNHEGYPYTSSVIEKNTVASQPTSRSVGKFDYKCESESRNQDCDLQSHPFTHIENENNEMQNESCSKSSIPELDVIEELIKANFDENMKERGKYRKDGEFEEKSAETILLAGDSILNDIDSTTLSTKYKVENTSFPGCSTHEMIAGLTHLLQRKPAYVILHLACSDNTQTTLTSVLKNLQLLKSHVLRCLPSASVVICCPMVENEDRKSRLV